MTEAMIVEAVRAAGAVQGIQNAQAVAPAMDPQAVQRFQAAMAPQAPTDIPFVAQVAETFTAVQNSHQAHMHRVEALSRFSSVHPFSSRDLFELHYEISSLLFQQDIVSNVAKKASDAVTTLIRNG